MIRILTVAVLISAVVGVPSLAQEKRSENAVRHVVEQFERGLEQRDLKLIEPLMAEDLVALENGHRNDGWADFRDNHLLPEMREPMPPHKTELLRVKATPNMGWAYTRTDMTLTRKTGEKTEAVLYSTYIVEKRENKWVIALLDWSMRVKR